MNTMPLRVSTVGHSNHLQEILVGLLEQHGVNTLADVRSAPYSRFNPQFNRENLKDTLSTCGIRYVYLGRELGGRPEDSSCYDESGRVQYRLVARTELLQGGIERVMHGAGNHCIALMCAEKEPMECHRTLLVSEALAGRSVVVSHILEDGSLESHHSVMDRLLDVRKACQESLFDLDGMAESRSGEESRSNLIAQAIERQARRLGYVEADFKVARNGETGL